MEKNDKILFHTVITSQRHRELGFCEPSDFGTIKLLSLQPSEKQLIVSFKEYDKRTIEFIQYGNHAYRKVDCNSNLKMSRDEQEVQNKKQGKYSIPSAVKLMLQIRERAENTYSCVYSYSFILIDKTLYEEYSTIDRLNITVCGNLLFSYWLSISIESHGNKQEHFLNKKTYERVFKEERKRFNKHKPKAGMRIGDGHVSFSYPKQIKWGANYIG